uniref:Uncharacterized protein n=1 Tax=Cryptomonas curvata TaxID=233186 RepID=A0A7S0MVG2_9CRYP|mmetsp:Transcript_55349/g.115770  ORF Transcript_55349/g.115770 Transcript_55349/m.115770 type:complete len:244 (+) Transcript_55349:86-817(+)
MRKFRIFLQSATAIRYLKPTAANSRSFFFFNTKAFEVIERLSAEKDKVFDRLLAEKENSITIFRDSLVEAKAEKLKLQSRFNAVLADRSVVEMSAVAYRWIMKLGNLSATKTVEKIVDDFILEPQNANSSVRNLKAEAVTALSDLQATDKSFAQVSNANLAREMEVAYHNLSQRIHFPDNSSLSEGMYVGSGTMVSRAMIAVFTCIAQKHSLYDDTVRLLNMKGEYSCTISNGRFVHIPPPPP